jgi:acetoacetyl-CoA synthetase
VTMTDTPFTDTPVIREPQPRDRQHSHMARYQRWLADAGYGRFDDYAALHRWSISDLEQFWESVVRYCGVRFDTPPQAMIGRRTLGAAEWLPGARLSYAWHALRHAEGARAQAIAVVSHGEEQPTRRYSYAQLRADVGAFEAFLRASGVVAGDRVAALISNGYEAIVGLLASTSLGAIWSSASPDFGADAAHDRFGQIEPTVLIAVNGYRFGGRAYPRAGEVEQLASRLPGLRALVTIEQLPGAPMPEHPRARRWDSVLAEHAGALPSYTPLPADHPLCILYSSGTTGKPKCIVHGVGGILLNHVKELTLHGDLGEGDQLLYYTTCGWMMWNWQTSALLTGACVHAYDGSPGYPDLDRLWALAAEERLTHFGTSARFIASCRKAQLEPARQHALERLRLVFSTASPLLPEDYDWFTDALPPHTLLASIAGGTDICACFVGATPTLPLRRGEIQCRLLGVDVVAVDADGRVLPDGERGELVCRQPLPSMPVGFWRDSDGSRYRKAYFERYPGVWAHGDFIRFTAHGGAVIYGRSDATLNPGGVRIGTAEIYRQVETVDAIRDSLVAARAIDGDVEVVLLVVMAEGHRCDEALCTQLRARIRSRASPRHVPHHILAVADIPYTRSAKKVELAVTRLLAGEQPGDNLGALANPECLVALRATLGAAGLLPDVAD